MTPTERSARRRQQQTAREIRMENALRSLKSSAEEGRVSRSFVLEVCRHGLGEA